MSDGKVQRVPCGLYRTTRPLGTGIQAGVLVYYHNHGNPSPGLYPVERWSNNKAVFAEHGVIVHDHRYPETLHPLPPEGFYRVVEGFACCERECQRFEPDALVQLGYNGAGKPILFLPIWSEAGVHLPDNGVRVDDDRLALLAPLKVPFQHHPPLRPEEASQDGSPPDDHTLLH